MRFFRTEYFHTTGAVLAFDRIEKVYYCTDEGVSDIYVMDGSIVTVDGDATNVMREHGVPCCFIVKRGEEE